MVTVSFPGLGIGPLSFNKIAFSIGKIEVRWYGIIIVCGILLAMSYAYYRSKFEKISLDDLLDYALFAIFFGIVGARAYYVLTTLDSGNYKTFWDYFKIWEGGIAIYGAIIGGAAAIILVSLKKKIKITKALDMTALAVMIGQIVGRWGNFFNGEAYGVAPDESNPLYFLRMELNGKIVQPTFLYESVWNLCGFLVINAFYKKKKFDGQITASYFAWYGFGRFFIESLRTDSLMVGSFRISRIVAFVCFVASVAVMAAAFIAIAKGKLAPLGGERLGAADTLAQSNACACEEIGDENCIGGDAKQDTELARPAAAQNGEESKATSESERHETSDKMNDLTAKTDDVE